DLDLVRPEAPAQSTPEGVLETRQGLHDDPVSHEGVEVRARQQGRIATFLEGISRRPVGVTRVLERPLRGAEGVGTRIVVDYRDPITPGPRFEYLVRHFDL